MPTAEQAVDSALANDHAVHEVEEEALNVDEDVALALDEPKRCRQTEHTLRVDDEAFLSTVCGIEPPGWGAGSNSRC